MSGVRCCAVTAIVWLGSLLGVAEAERSSEVMVSHYASMLHEYCGFRCLGGRCRRDAAVAA